MLREPSVKLVTNHLEQAFTNDDRHLSKKFSLNPLDSSETFSRSNLKISIVAIARYATDAVVKTLESLVQQTFAHWEAIVIFDNSCDHLEQILIDFAERDSRIILVNQSQTSISVARNLGAELAQHDWLLFIDAGDWLFPEHLEKLTEQIIAAPESDLVFCNWALFTAEGEQRDGLAYNVAKFYDLQASLSNCMRVCHQFPLNACLVKKTVFQEVGGFAIELATCEDWDLWQRIIARAGICWTSVNLILAGCLLKPKRVFLDSQQLLIDGLRIITRGYKNNSQLQESDSNSAKGSSLREIADAQFYWTGYCVGIAIALNQDYLSLLSHLTTQENFAALSINFEPIFLDRAIVNGIRDAAYTNSEDFLALWHCLQPKIVQFFQKLTQYSGILFKTDPRIKSIEMVILERILPIRPITLTQFHAIDCDITQPILDLTIPLESEILNCRVKLEKKVLGNINLPVFEGQVSGLVLADAIANRYVWQILDCFFKQNIYSELSIKQTESGIVVKRGNCILAENLTPGPNLRKQISEKITWKVFLQELWGLTDWKHSNLSPISTATAQVLTINNREWLIVEVSEDLTDIAVTQNTLQTVIQVGGVSIGVMTIKVEDEVLTTTKLRTEIVTQAGFELARAAVREGLLGKSFTGELSLRERLSEAAREKRNLTPQQLIANTALPNTGSLLNQTLSPKQKTVIFGYRQAQPIGTSASRWTMLPTSIINELTDCTKLLGESAIEIGDAQQPPRQVLYSPDLIVPQAFARRSTAGSNFQHKNNSHASGYTYNLPILMYHHVSPHTPDEPNQWHLSSQLFEQQLHYLRNQGFYSVTLEDWRKSILTRQPLPGKAIIITFDDGYQNFFTYAWPLLKKYGFSAIVFLIIDDIGSQIEDTCYMGWSEIKHLLKQGVEFGSHSLNHPSFTDISYVEVVRQGTQSRAILSKELGISVDAFAYPYGHYNSLVGQLVGSCGYIFGLQVGCKHSTWQDSFLGLFRIEIDNKDTLQRFIWKIKSSNLM